MQVVYHVAQRTNGLAITSAITGILSYLLCPIIGAIVAVATGHAARGQIRRLNEGGWGWATAGLVLGYAHFAIWGLILVLFFSVCGGLAALGTLATLNGPKGSSIPVVRGSSGDIPCDQLEHTQVHYHAAIQILDGGTLHPISGGIGIQGGETAPSCYYWLHVHSANQDVVHIEAPADRVFTLGDFFKVWDAYNTYNGMPHEQLDATHVSTLTIGPNQALVVYIDIGDGKGAQVYPGDPTEIVLISHEVITLEITPPIVNPPPVFTFASGL